MLTKEDYGNILSLIDRALRSEVQPGGIKDHMATAVLVQKLIQLGKANGEDTTPSN